MNKKDKIEIESLKENQDFSALHNLNQLKKHYETIAKLKKETSNFEEAYVSSFYKDLDEVLNYIPQSEYEKYNVNITPINNFRIIRIDVRDFAVPRQNIHELDFISKLRELDKSNGKNKVFLVNTIKKEIDFCPVFGVDDPKKISLINEDYSLEKKGYGYSYPYIRSGNGKGIIELVSNFNYSTWERRGGVWISTYGGKGYWGGPGAKDVEIGHTVSTIYSFCMKTNRYIGSKYESY